MSFGIKTTLKIFGFEYEIIVQPGCNAKMLKASMALEDSTSTVVCLLAGCLSAAPVPSPFPELVDIDIGNDVGYGDDDHELFDHGFGFSNSKSGFPLVSVSVTR